MAHGFNQTSSIRNASLSANEKWLRRIFIGISKLMEIIPTKLQGLLIIQPKKIADDRGLFYEVFQQKKYEQAGIPAFVQDNFSLSKKNVLRGLHYQLPHSQGKLV